MTIASLDNYIGALKQVIPYSKTAARTSVANVWFAVHDLAGNPGAATLAAGNTANGLVPTDTAGFPMLGFSSGLGYLAIVDFGSSVACRMSVYDRLFHAGGYAYNSGTTTLSAQPSYSSRVPGGTDYTGLQIWLEVTTAFVTGTTWSVTVTYTNQAGTTGHTTVTTGSMTAANMTLGKMLQLALQAGDTGVQKIESVIVVTGGMTAGAFNVVVARPLWSGRVSLANSGDCHGIDRTGLPQVWTDSALTLMIAADSTSTGLPDLQIEIASN